MPSISWSPERVTATVPTFKLLSALMANLLVHLQDAAVASVPKFQAQGFEKGRLGRRPSFLFQSRPGGVQFGALFGTHSPDTEMLLTDGTSLRPGFARYSGRRCPYPHPHRRWC